MIDMGMIDGKHVFYGGGRSIIELMRDGEIVAIPDANDGIAYKRTERCSALELAAAYTVEEARKVTDEWNSRINEKYTLF